MALALAGVGPEETVFEIWADPAVDRNTHSVRLPPAPACLLHVVCRLRLLPAACCLPHVVGCLLSEPDVDCLMPSGCPLLSALFAHFLLFCSALLSSHHSI